MCPFPGKGACSLVERSKSHYTRPFAPDRESIDERCRHFVEGRYKDRVAGWSWVTTRPAKRRNVRRTPVKRPMTRDCGPFRFLLLVAGRFTTIRPQLPQIHGRDPRRIQTASPLTLASVSLQRSARPNEGSMRETVADPIRRRWATSAPVVCRTGEGLGSSGTRETCRC
jgi:hypothetical protein